MQSSLGETRSAILATLANAIETEKKQWTIQKGLTHENRNTPP
jgi:hypothetical protein